MARAWYAALRAARHDNERWWATYTDYLASPEWEVRRTRALARTGGWCEGCGQARATQVHHRSYRRVGDEPPEHLAALCWACHQNRHPNRTPGSFEELWAAAGHKESA